MVSSELLFTCNAGGERNWSVWRRVWSNARNHLHSGRVALLVYYHYNQWVLDRTNDRWACLDWESFIDAVEQDDPIRAPEGHSALDVPGAYTLSWIVSAFVASRLINSTSALQLMSDHMQVWSS